MIKDLLWDRFWERSRTTDNVGCVKEAWDEVVVPHLNIPRSLNDDPPEDGKDIIVLKGDVSAMRISYHDSFNEIHAGKWTHWIPRPEISKEDKDDQEFEAWYKDLNKEWDKDNCKIIWMAGRKAK